MADVDFAGYGSAAARRYIGVIVDRRQRPSRRNALSSGVMIAPVRLAVSLKASGFVEN
jgi:hypothetical protein